jgi:ABC-2 type transport system permease protein
MNQLFTLIRYDLRSQLRERGTVMLLALGLALALFGLFEGARFARHGAQASAGAAAQEDGARAAAAGLAARYFGAPADPALAALQWYRNPADVRGYAFYQHVGFAAKPAAAGAALAIAQADVLPAYVRVRADSMESVRTASEIEHPARLAAGRFDLMFFVVYMWPLVLLALTMSVLTQDRESGRLRALQLQGVGLGRMLLAQVLARSLLAGAALVAAVAAAALLSGALAADAGAALALLLWAGVVLLYSLFWAGVAAVVCALCHTRMTAAFAGFGAWLVLAVLLPGALTAGVRLGAPLPSRESYVQAMRDANDAVQANRLGSLARFYDQHPEWKPGKTALDKVSSSVTRIQRAEELENALLPVEQAFDGARARQQRLFAQLAPASPVTLAYQALAEIAGNDAGRQQAFIGEVRAHQLRLRAFFQRAIQEAALGDEGQSCAATCLGGYGFRDFDAVPRFQASAGLAEATLPAPRAAALALWAAALFGLALWLLRRGRVS